MDLISVIVPMYNTEKYVGECIESLTKQSYENIEIIIVNDCSTDNSLGICKDYANLDNRIQIINTPDRKGLSEAKNIGLEHAKGEYIAFVDSDDYITKDYLESLYIAIQDFNVDIAQCDFYKMDDNDEIIGSYKEYKDGLLHAHIYSGREMIKNIYNSEMSVATTRIWTKLYKRELLFTKTDCFADENEKKFIRFPKGMTYEDEAFSYKVFDNVNKAVVINKRLYCYRVLKDCNKNRYSYGDLDEIKHLEERLRVFKNKKDIGLYYITLKKYYYSLISALSNSFIRYLS